ncbi:MAG: hypothetical protein IKL17_01845, partial [Alistipes sp.]|nr:hypothetical protein [Alistipes sp.]
MKQLKDRGISTALMLALYAQIWLYQFIGLIIFVVARTIHLFANTTLETVVAHSDSIPLFLWNSWRFDIQALSYISLPVILASLIVPWFG